MQQRRMIWLLALFILALMGRTAPTTGLAKICLPRSDPLSFNTGLRAIKKDPNGVLRAGPDDILRSFAPDGTLIDSYQLGEFWVPPSESSDHVSSHDKDAQLETCFNKSWLPASEPSNPLSSLDNADESWAPPFELGSHSTSDEKIKLSKHFYKPVVSPLDPHGQVSTPDDNTQLDAGASRLTPSRLGKYASMPGDVETAYNHLDKSWAPPSQSGDPSSTSKETSELAFSLGIKPAKLDIDNEILGECSPPVYCVDSSTCGGGCGSCTYIGWFPYGLCLVG